MRRPYSSIAAAAILGCAVLGAAGCHRETRSGSAPPTAADVPGKTGRSDARGEPRASGGPRPDVLLVIVDTLRADFLGSYGFPFDTSPNVDALARDSVVFERAIAASSATAPSHASIFTSRYPRQHTVGYVNGATRLQNAVTLAERFRAAGYSTAAFVGNLILQRRFGFDRGFDVYDDDLPESERNRPAFFERIAEQTTERALAWLEHAGEGPIFLWVHYQDPHGPYDPPPPYAGHIHIPPAEGEKPLPVLGENQGLDGIPSYQALDGLRLPSEYKSRYADEIHYADHSIGALLAAFDAHAGERGSIVLFTADHGESLGEGYRYFLHGLVSTPDVARVPLILRAPGLAPGRRSDTVSHVDVMPTLLELAGLPIPEGLSGIALGPYLREGRPLPERLVYCDAGDELSAYRDEDFLRVRGVQAPWIAASGAPAPETHPAWLMYAWSPEGAWSREKLLPEWKPEIRGYYEQVVPMRTARGWDAEDLERLRALGYLDPQQNAGS